METLFLEFLVGLFIVRSVPFYVIEKNLFFWVVVRRNADNEFIEEKTEKVPVNCSWMSLFSQYFRSKIGHWTAKAACGVVVDSLFGESEVSESAMSFGIKDDIIRFEISEDNHIFMQSLEGKN